MADFSTLTEAFATLDTTTRWTVTGSASVSGSDLRLRTDTFSYSNMIKTQAKWGLNSSGPHGVVEFVPYGTRGDGNISWAILNSAGYGLVIEQYSASAYRTFVDGAGFLGASAFACTDVFWRVRLDSSAPDTAHVESSSDQVTWTLRRSQNMSPGNTSFEWRDGGVSTFHMAFRATNGATTTAVPTFRGINESAPGTTTVTAVVATATALAPVPGVSAPTPVNVAAVVATATALAPVPSVSAPTGGPVTVSAVVATATALMRTPASTGLANVLVTVPGPATATALAPAPAVSRSRARLLNNFSDDFSSGDLSHWGDASPTAQVVDGVAVLRANGERLLTTEYFQVRNSSFIVRIDRLPVGPCEVFLGLVNEVDSGTGHREIGFYISRIVSGGRTATRLRYNAAPLSVDGGPEALSTVYIPDDPNYPSPMRYLRLDIDPGVHGGATWYTSPDAVTWTARYDYHGGKANAGLGSGGELAYAYTDVESFYLLGATWRGAMRVLISAAGGASTSTLRVDNVNILPQGLGTPVEFEAKPARISTTSTTEFLLYALDPALYDSSGDVSLAVPTATASTRFPTGRTGRATCVALVPAVHTGPGAPTRSKPGIRVTTLRSRKVRASVTQN